MQCYYIKDKEVQIICSENSYKYLIYFLIVIQAYQLLDKFMRFPNFYNF